MRAKKIDTSPQQPGTQIKRPHFFRGHVYKVEGTRHGTEIDKFYLACVNGGKPSLHSLADGNRWSSHEDGPFGADSETHYIWTNVNARVEIDLGDA